MFIKLLVCLVASIAIGHVRADAPHSFQLNSRLSQVGAKAAFRTHSHHLENALLVPRGGSETIIKEAVKASTDAVKASSSNLVIDALNGLQEYMKGSKADTLLLLATTAFNAPLCQKIGLSPILGFLFLGVLFGPNGYGLVKDVHTTEMLADIGIVFFLFEMGIHLSFNTLMKMKSTVFGLGGSQFAITALAVGVAATMMGVSKEAAIILGGGLALSSSAFVLQLLKDKKMLETEYGKTSFGVLLLQDLMVVPLLVITPILAGGGDGIGAAVTSALVQIAIALSVIGCIGKFLMGPIFDKVAAAKLQEPFVGLILLTVLGMSFLTEGLGLSNTLGAFLAGVLLAESAHRHHIEVEASPIRGILVGLFFFTVGFEIDVSDFAIWSSLTYHNLSDSFQLPFLSHRSMNDFCSSI